MASIIKTISKDDLQQLVNSSKSLSEVLRKLRFKSQGASFGILKKRILSDQIDLSTMQRKVVGNTIVVKRKTLDEVLVDGSAYGRGSIKKRLIANGMLKNVCSKCGQEPLWKGVALVMILDHINGKNDDNRLENLRLICPNCNSQTSTFSGRNPLADRSCESCGKLIGGRFSKCQQCRDDYRKRGGKCIDCGKSIFRLAERCRECSHRTMERVPNRPKGEELAKLVKNSSFSGVGRIYGVSGTTVRKWIAKDGVSSSIG